MTFPRRAILSLCALLTLCTACPNPSIDDMDMSATMSDMSPQLDADDMAPDGSNSMDMPPDTTRDDMPDAASAMSCLSLRTSPRTMPLGVEPPDLTWTLDCARDISAFTLSARQSDQMLDASQASCSPQEEGFLCELTLSGVQLPEPSREVASPQTLELKLEDAPLATSEIRWHRPVSQLDAALELPPSLALPQGFSERGLDARVRTIAGQVHLFTTIRSASDERVSLQVTRPHSTDAVLTTLEVDVMASDLLAQGFELLEEPELQQVEALWWGYDSVARGFVGLSVVLDATTGEVIRKTSHTVAAPSALTLQSVVDVYSFISERPDPLNPDVARAVTQLLILGKSSGGQVVIAQPFEKDDPLEMLEPDTFLGLSDAQVTPSTLGFVTQLGREQDLVSTTNDDYALLWSSVTSATKDGVTLSFKPASGAPSKSQEVFTGFEVTHTYVSQLEPGALLVLMHGTQERALFHVQIDPVSGEILAVDSAELPHGVDLRPEPASVEVGDHQIWSASPFVAMSCRSGKRCDDGRFKMVARARGLVFGKSVYTESEADEFSSVVVTWREDLKLEAVHPLTLDATNPSEDRSLTVTSIDPVRDVMHVHHSSLDVDACAEDGCVRITGHTSLGTPITVKAAQHGLEVCLMQSGSRGDWCHPQFSAGAPMLELRAGGQDAPAHILTWVDPDTVQEPLTARTLGLFVKGLDTPIMLQTLTDSESRASFMDSNPLFSGPVIYYNALSADGRTVPDILIVGTRSSQGAVMLHTFDLSSDQVYVERDVRTAISVVSPLLASAPVAASLTSVDESNSSFFPEEMSSDIRAKLTPEQAAQPLLVYARPGEGACSTLTVSAISTSPDAPAMLSEVLAVPATREDCADELSLAGITDFDGDDAPGVGLSARVIIGNRNRIKQKPRRYRKREPEPEIRCPSCKVIEPLQGPIASASEIARVYGDFNGDGLGDVHIITTPYMPEGSTQVVHGLVIFSDGLGASLQTTWPVVTSPDSQWSTGPIQALAAGRGSGTKRSATKARARPALQ